MITQTDINKKAMHEAILYYLRERIDENNNGIKHIIITNLYEWFVLDAHDFERLFYKSNLNKEYVKWKSGQKTSANTPLFYTEIARPLLADCEKEISATWFDLRDYQKALTFNKKEDERKLTALYKIISDITLLKEPFANDSNSLDRKFYNELVLDFKTREIVTIAALASLGGVENQLRSHFNVGMYNGLTEGQLKQIVSIIGTRIGSKEGNEANKVLQTILNQKQGISNSGSSTQNLPGKHPFLLTDTVFPTGNKITNQNFAGNVWLYMMVTDSTVNTSVGNVTFEPGARTNWHYHPDGQILLVIGGVGYYQEKGSPKRILRKGDVVTCPPNKEHWHGASKDQPFIQMAVTSTQKGPTVWLGKVSDEEYHSEGK